MIARAFAKYGVHRMKLQILDEHVALSDLNDREIARIAEHGTFDPNGTGYNLTPGGEQSPMLVPAVAARSSITHKRQWQDPAHRAKMSKAKKQSKSVQENMAKMRASKQVTDYWAMTRKQALRLLTSSRSCAKARARDTGIVFDSSWYDQEIVKHEKRHKEEYHGMPAAKAVRALQAALSAIKRFNQQKGRAFDKEWWYVEQIEVHKARARTSCLSL